MPKKFEVGKIYHFRNITYPSECEFIGSSKDGLTSVFLTEFGTIQRLTDGRSRAGQDGDLDVMPDVDRTEIFANIYSGGTGLFRDSLDRCMEVARSPERVGILKVTYEDGLPVSAEIIDPAEVYKD